MKKLIFTLAIALVGVAFAGNDYYEPTTTNTVFDSGLKVEVATTTRDNLKTKGTVVTAIKVSGTVQDDGMSKMPDSIYDQLPSKEDVAPIVIPENIDEMDPSITPKTLIERYNKLAAAYEQLLEFLKNNHKPDNPTPES